MSNLLKNMSRLNACVEATKWVAAQTGNDEEIWTACERGDWMLWLAGRVGVDRKALAFAAAQCARLALKYVTAGEDRPRMCIETVERWCQGEATMAEVKAARSAAAYAAAYAADAADAAAHAAAHAAAYDDADAAAYAADAADAAAHAAAAAYDDADARRASRAESARLVRVTITWDMIEEKLK